jgi:hypothetical protein
MLFYTSEGALKYEKIRFVDLARVQFVLHRRSLMFLTRLKRMFELQQNLIGAPEDEWKILCTKVHVYSKLQ